MIIVVQRGDHEDITNYFDKNLKNSWAKPKHFKIRGINNINKFSTSTSRTSTARRCTVLKGTSVKVPSKFAVIDLQK